MDFCPIVRIKYIPRFLKTRNYFKILENEILVSAQLVKASLSKFNFSWNYKKKIFLILKCESLIAYSTQLGANNN